MPFFQTPPSLGNQFTGDRVLRSYLARKLPEDVRKEIEPSLTEMGELAGGVLNDLFEQDRQSEPKLVQWDAWGKRVDRIEVTPLWKEVAKIGTRLGVIGTGAREQEATV